MRANRSQLSHLPFWLSNTGKWSDHAPAEKRCFCPKKERYWPKIEPIFDNFSNPVN
jgi:hypothetical protein